MDLGGDYGMDFGFLGRAELTVGQLTGGEIPHTRVTKEPYWRTLLIGIESAVQVFEELLNIGRQGRRRCLGVLMFLIIPFFQPM